MWEKGGGKTKPQHIDGGGNNLPSEKKKKPINVSVVGGKWGIRIRGKVRLNHPRKKKVKLNTRKQGGKSTLEERKEKEKRSIAKNLGGGGAQGERRCIYTFGTAH